MNSKNKKLLAKIKNNNKQTSLKKIKRKKKIELTAIFLVFTLILGFALYMFSPYVKLKNINVSGNQQLSTEEILAAGNINENVKTWTVKDNDVENNIKDKYNIIKSISVTSKMPRTINISIEEFKIIAQNKTEDGQYQIILENGNIYTGTIRNNFNLPVLEGFKDNKTKLSEVYKNLTNLKEEVRQEISEIKNDDDSDTITLYMKDGQKVKALSSDFSEKLNYYDEMAKYITDKNKTILNLVNGAYVETQKSDKEKNQKIKNLLNTAGTGNTSNVSQKSNFEGVEDKTEDKKNSTSQSTNTKTKTQTTNQKQANSTATTNNKSATTKKVYTP